jgi:hypothetical protein
LTHLQRPDRRLAEAASCLPRLIPIVAQFLAKRAFAPRQIFCQLQPALDMALVFDLKIYFLLAVTKK